MFVINERYWLSLNIHISMPSGLEYAIYSLYRDSLTNNDYNEKNDNVWVIFMEAF